MAAPPRALLPRHQDRRAHRRRARAPASERSLERLRVDQVDLIQLHNLVDEDEWETALGPGGALEALVEARDRGLVRFIGVTGHGTRVAEMHRRSLERFPFDSVLLPYNFTMLQHARSTRADFEALLALCRERGVAVQTIKSVARRRWQGDGAAPLQLVRAADATRTPSGRAVHFVLGAAGPLPQLVERRHAAARTSSTPHREPVARPPADGARRGRRALRDRAALRPRRVAKDSDALAYFRQTPEVLDAADDLPGRGAPSAAGSPLSTASKKLSDR